MAIDPNLPEDQKKRLRRPQFGLGITGSAGAPILAAQAPVTPRELVRRTPSDPNLHLEPLGPDEWIRRTPTDPNAPALPGERRPAPTARTAPVDHGPPEDALAAFVAAQDKVADTRRGALHERGARRLFRGQDAQGNTVYTDKERDPLMAGAGEERYYGADGWRIDEGLQAPNTAALVPGQGRAAGLRRTSNEFFDQLDERNNEQLAAIGGREQWVKDQTARNEQAALASRAEGMQRLGYSDAAIAKALGTDGQQADFGDMIRLMQLQETRNNNALLAEDRAENRANQARGLQRQERADLLERYTPEQRPETLRQELQILRNMSNEDRRAFFNSEDPAERERANLLLANINTALGDTYQQNADNWIPGSGFALDRPQGFGDLRQQAFWKGGGNPFKPRYVSAGDEWQRGVTGDELAAVGISEEDLPWLMDFMSRQDFDKDSRR